METKLFIVLLRRPQNWGGEMRSDPFWEFGSFGLTGCHKRNLLNINKVERLTDSRFAFVQGGNDGFKLLLITSPVKTIVNSDIVEVKWEPIKLPFKYMNAPMVIRNDTQTSFPYLSKYFLNHKRSTLEGKFASAFRSRTTPLDHQEAQKLMNDFERMYKNAKLNEIILDYTEALPYLPQVQDNNRTLTYKKLKNPNRKKC